MNSQWQRERQAVCIIVWGVCLCITIRDLSWRERWLTDTDSSVWTVGLRGRTAGQLTGTDGHRAWWSASRSQWVTGDRGQEFVISRGIPPLTQGEREGEESCWCIRQQVLSSVSGSRGKPVPQGHSSLGKTHPQGHSSLMPRALSTLQGHLLICLNQRPPPTLPHSEVLSCERDYQMNGYVFTGLQTKIIHNCRD